MPGWGERGGGIPGCGERDGKKGMGRKGWGEMDGEKGWGKMGLKRTQKIGKLNI